MRIERDDLQVPYIADETIEGDAEALLSNYAHANNRRLRLTTPSLP
jgi:hypothetical protein